MEIFSIVESDVLENIIELSNSSVKYLRVFINEPNKKISSPMFIPAESGCDLNCDQKHIEKVVSKH